MVYLRINYDYVEKTTTEIDRAHFPLFVRGAEKYKPCGLSYFCLENVFNGMPNRNECRTKVETTSEKCTNVKYSGANMMILVFHAFPRDFATFVYISNVLAVCFHFESVHGD